MKGLKNLKSLNDLIDKVPGKDKKTKILIIAGVIGLGLGLLALRSKTKAKTGTKSSSVYPGNGVIPGVGASLDGGGGGSTIGDSGNTGSGGGIISKLGDRLNIDLDYILDTSNEFAASAFKDQSSSGGGSLGFSGGGFGFSLGASKSNTNIRKAEVLETARDLFDNRSSAENINDEQLDKLLGFFKEIGGTYEGRQERQQQRQEDARNTAERIIGTNVVAQGSVTTTATSRVNNDQAIQVAHRDINWN